MGAVGRWTGCRLTELLLSLRRCGQYLWRLILLTIDYKYMRHHSFFCCSMIVLIIIIFHCDFCEEELHSARFRCIFCLSWCLFSHFQFFFGSYRCLVISLSSMTCNKIYICLGKRVNEKKLEKNITAIYQFGLFSFSLFSFSFHLLFRLYFPFWTFHSLLRISCRYPPFLTLLNKFIFHWTSVFHRNKNLQLNAPTQRHYKFGIILASLKQAFPACHSDLRGIDIKNRAAG